MADNVRKSIHIHSKTTTIGGESQTDNPKSSKNTSKTSIVSFAVEWDDEGLEEVEVAAQITVPVDGGWGWVVVATSFFIGFVNDGILYTFGSLLTVVAKDLGIKDSLAAVINSVTVASYYCCGPVVSALINRFGFRLCAMTGAIISSFSCLFTIFFGNFASFIIFYGLISGFGYAMSNMPAFIIVGFYFQKWRSLAFTFAITGCSVGIVFFNQFNSYVSREASWQTVLLGQSCFLAFTYFLAMTFRPLLSMSVVQTTEIEEETTTLAQIPSISRTSHRVKSYARIPTTGHYRESGKAYPTHRFFNAVSNMNFPTAATIIEDANEADVSAISLNAAGPSTYNKSRITLVPYNAKNPIHENELKKVKSMIAQSQANLQKRAKIEAAESQIKPVDIVLSVPEKQVLRNKRPFWKSLFRWEKHIDESRPMYRDDAFYEKNFKTTPVSRDDDEDEQEDAIEYQLRVSRAAATSDLQERRGVCTTAFRRVLATMLDPVLLRRKSFLLICFSMFMIYLGYLIPMVFVAHRGRALGIDNDYCGIFLSVIGFSGIIGRFVQGIVALKVHPLSIAVSVYTIAGISTIMSGFGKTVVIQLLYCFIYGFTTSSSSTLRSMALVKLYGIENLTNCTGIVVLFQGLGCLLSTPAAGLLKDLFGYQAAFIFSGTCLTIGGLLTLPIKSLIKKEERVSARTSVKMPRTRSVIIKTKGQ